MQLLSDMFYLNQLKYNYAKEIFRRMQDLPYAIVKGEPLSLSAYGRLGCRGFGDIDFLLPRSYLRKMEDILLSLGFQTRSQNREDRIFLMSCSHQISEYTKCYDGSMNIEVDLNFDILWGEYTGKRIDIGNFLLDAVSVNIYGVEVKTLPPMKALIQLALHEYKDMNSIYLLAIKKSNMYKKLRDFYFLFKNNIQDIPLEALYLLCKKYEIIPYIYYIFYFTSLLYEDEELTFYKNKFYCEDGEKLLDYYGLNELEKKMWRVDYITRINSENLYSIIKPDLSEKDFKKIEINKRIFGA